ncbi:MAG: amidohydrolase family protein, partial [Pseudomonadota bacterium]
CIHCMNASNPTASHVAVRDGSILGVGALDDLQGFGDYELDERFADHILLPGFVEGHAHVMEGSMWKHVYCGYFDRYDPHGKQWQGVQTIATLIERLHSTAQDRAPGTPVTGWQYDPIYLSQKLNRHDLDKVGTDRAVGIFHASVHILNVNTKALALAGLMREGIEHPGIILHDDGLPTGELKGPEAMFLVTEHLGLKGSALDGDEQGLRDFAKLCVRSGTTTITDLAANLDDDMVAMMARVTAEDDFPARIVPFRIFLGLPPKDLAERVKSLKARTQENLRLGAIKIIADGSIQGFSARLRPPGYYNGAPNGLWYVAPDQMYDILTHALQEDLLVHIHTNGDQATELVLQVMERALRANPPPNHPPT